MGIHILQDSYATILCAVIIVCSLFYSRKKFDRHLVRLFMITISLAVIEAIAGSAERYIGEYMDYHPMRLVLSWVCYCVAPGILLSVAETIMRDAKSWKRWLIAVPEIINVLVTSTAFFGPWCFSMDPVENHFISGPLIYVPRYTLILYLVIAMAVAFVNIRKSKWECTTALLGALLIAFNYIDETDLHILGNAREITIAIAILAYFMYFVSERHIDEVDEIQQEHARKSELHSKEMLDQAIETLAYTIDAKDRYTKGHSSRVAKYARMIGSVYGKTEEECRQIYLTGLLHDIGKISISGKIINKPGRLTDEEFEEIKKHPANGAKILEKMRTIPYLQDGAKYHHERYDGKGYPQGLKGEEIPELARIIAVADAYDAMTSYRSYRPVMEQAAVKQEIWKSTGSQFDPLFAKIMISLIDADVHYDMREKPGEQDEINFDDSIPDIVWPVAPVKQSEEQPIENALGSLAASICSEDKWYDPIDGIEIHTKQAQVKFIGKMWEEAQYVWNTPVVLIYSSEDGKVLGKNYDELGVFMSAGYGWQAGSSLYEQSGFSKNAAFVSWDNFIERNKEGLDYSMSIRQEKNIVLLDIWNELLTFHAKLVLPEDFSKKIYVAISGEKCVISDVVTEQ